MAERTLPTPSGERWRPLRGGLLNLYLYDDQEFLYERGRLLLRGNNGTGKSRVLALQLPFLLDGQVSASRVEPDADPAKKIEWHLLMGHRYPQRTGYTWIEFGRAGESGEGEIVTLGIGLEAVQGRGLKDRWYFVTDQRVGRELELKGPQGVALNKKEIETAIEGRGRVFDRSEEYRDEVDRRLFQLGRERYEALLSLLLGLRRPQLTRRLDEKNLSDALSLALPPLSATLLDEIADAFRKLEADRSELARYRSTAEIARAFEDLHRRYVGIEGRRRAAEVRGTHARYEETSRQRTAKRAELEEAEAESRRLADALERLGEREDALEAQEQALLSSDAMKAVHELERLVRAVADAERARERQRGQRDGAKERLERGVAEALAAERERDAREAELIEDAREVEARAREARLEPPALPLGPDDADERRSRSEAFMERAPRIASERQRALAHLQSLEDAQRAAQATFERAEFEAATMRQSAEEATLRRERAAYDLTEAGDAYLGSVARYVASLSWLVIPSADTLDRETRAWLEAPMNAPPVLSAAEASAHRASEAQHALRAEARRARETAEAKRELLSEELARLEAGEVPGPTPSTGRDHEARRQRPGGALWAVSEFRGEVDASDRAKLEAALEASGLLDAWISPEGDVVARVPDAASTDTGASDAGDAFLLPDEAAPGPSLADVLVPARDLSDPRAAALSDERVRAVLGSVGLGPSAHRAWVARDGAYRLGPLSGTHDKAAAQFIGHGAREAERKRRMETLRSELAVVEAEIATARAAIDAAEEALRAIRGERERAPSGREIPQRMALLAEAERSEGEARAVLLEGEAKRDDAARAVAAREAKLREDADALGLPRPLELPALREALRSFEAAVRGLGRAVSVRARAGIAADEARARAKRAEEELGRSELDLAEASRLVTTRAAERDELERMAGEGAKEVLARLAEVREQRAACRTERSSTQAARNERERVAGELAGALHGLEGKLAGEASARTDAASALLALLSTRCLAAFGASFGGEGLEGASITRIVELARALERSTSALPESKEARANAEQQVVQNVRAVQDALAGQATADLDSHRAGVLLLRISLQGAELGAAELVSHLDREVAERERLLAEEERAVIEKYLVDALAGEIVRSIHQASELVQVMNREVARCKLSTGMALRFQWRPAIDAGERFAACEPLFRRGPSLWTPPERAAVAEFLRDRITDAQHTHAALPAAERLARALDYRSFYRFEMLREKDGSWQKLTRHTHGTGSGGEKAVALTLPQLAAAAAHYESAKLAPRLILLDEAFVGIDSDARAKCMGMIENLDLDLVMTSEREWGCYPTIGALAIYQLTTRPGIDAILATRFVWNGKERIRADA